MNEKVIVQFKGHVKFKLYRRIIFPLLSFCKHKLIHTAAALERECNIGGRVSLNEFLLMVCHHGTSDKANKHALFKIYSLVQIFFPGISFGKLKSSLILALVLYSIIIV